MMHSFDIDIAREYGIHESIILGHLYFWIQKNRANGANFHEGTYWTYNSVKAFAELFPYMSPSAINRTLGKLEAQGLIITGNFNRSAYDRTKWYALTEKGLALFGDEKAGAPSGKAVVREDERDPARAQKSAETGPKRTEYPEGFEEFWRAYPRKTDKGQAYRCYCARVKDGYGAGEMLKAAQKYAAECEERRTEQRYIKQGKTFLGPATPFLDYLENETEKGTESEIVTDEEVRELEKFLESEGG